MKLLKWYCKPDDWWVGSVWQTLKGLLWEVSNKICLCWWTYRGYKLCVCVMITWEVESWDVYVRCDAFGYTRVMFLLLQTQFRTLWAAILWLLMTRHHSTTRSQMSSSCQHRNNHRSRMESSRPSDPSGWTYYRLLPTQTPLENLLWYMKRLVLSRVTCDHIDVMAIC